MADIRTARRRCLFPTDGPIKLRGTLAPRWVPRAPGCLPRLRRFYEGGKDKPPAGVVKDASCKVQWFIGILLGPAIRNGVRGEACAGASERIFGWVVVRHKSYLYKTLDRDGR